MLRASHTAYFCTTWLAAKVAGRSYRAESVVLATRTNGHHANNNEPLFITPCTESAPCSRGRPCRGVVRAPVSIGVYIGNAQRQQAPSLRMQGDTEHTGRSRRSCTTCVENALSLRAIAKTMKNAQVRSKICVMQYARMCVVCAGVCSVFLNPMSLLMNMKNSRLHRKSCC